jgi:thymidylate synthase ThyX
MFANIYNQAQSNWGESPSRVLYDADLTPDQWQTVEAIFDGKHLSNALEALTFCFLVDGCTRAATHELVRSRIGASFHQHGGRDNDWRNRKWTVSEALARACDVDRCGVALPSTHAVDPSVLKEKFFRYLEEMKVSVLGIDIDRVTQFMEGGDLDRLLYLVLAMQKAFYGASVDAGLAWQDARRILGIGHQTYLHCNYNFLALKGVLGHRLEHGACDWEIDCVAQLMQLEVVRNCPPIIAKQLVSNSDRAGVNKFATLYSWPPNGKHPTPSNWDPNRKTQFRREQMPFWVLDPFCYRDRTFPVTWIPTNGTYPHEEVENRRINTVQ